MKEFLGDDFLLNSETAIRLYHDIAQNLPIVDYHCHLAPQEIADDRHFNTITELLIGADHYKWRLMRANGVDESLITGDASDFEKFRAYAITIAKCAGNPLYHWTNLELKRYFGFNEPLCGQNCGRAYEFCNEKLKNNDFSVKSLITRSRVKLICTTDDPVDDLAYHRKIREDKTFTVKVIPAFRPDNALKIEAPDYSTYIDRLSEASKIHIDCYDAFLKALTQRINFFDNAGCRTADHGFDCFVFESSYCNSIDTIFKKALAGKDLTQSEINSFKTTTLLNLSKQYYERGWVMQIHFGCARNNNSAQFVKLGRDSGYDAIKSATGAEALTPFLDTLFQNGCLPKSIFYSLNDNDNRFIATTIGCFQGGEAGKLQLGAAWWFNDTKDGITRQIYDYASTGILGNFIGMLTDSRSYVAYSRHEYFRRILCDIVGEWVEKGELACNEETNNLIRNICYNNVVKYFGFELPLI